MLLFKVRLGMRGGRRKRVELGFEGKEVRGMEWDWIRSGWEVEVRSLVGE